MSAFTFGLSGIAAMLVLMFLRQPIWLALSLIGVGGNLILNGIGPSKFISGTAVFDVSSGYGLSVLPLFILLGEVASGSRMSAELFAAARTIMSGTRGGLGVATVAASGAFGAICGSSLATASSMTRIALPEMTRAGYNPAYAASTIAAGGTLGILIPPSIILVLYASISETSIARLFAASLIPGIFLMLLYIVVTKILARREDLAPLEEPATFGERLAALLKPWQFFLLFLVTIGGIYAGIFSPTEAASIGAFTAILIGIARGTLSIAGLVHAMKASVLISCALLMIVIGATIFANFVVQTRLPDNLLKLALDAGLSGWMVMAIIVLIYLVLGCFLEALGMVLITVPVFLPIIIGYGFDPIWFGVLVVVLVEVGLISPPVGMNLFIIRAQAPELKMMAIYRGILPFLAAPIVLIILLFVFPALALWLPRVLYQ
ncbi:tripartite ATP-independent transporter DctM subunit [Rhizobium sp. SJZ105]|uniref:TRAP transporter large permease n=1 Tax=Rhizobium sp. SJZ105 TaxID=2572678 RepID=UPI0011A8A4E5|nr:TRAP transporter large permease [Rhizobium sp. SJZ105]TWC76373.1 tripartite ATP-independent transporter DctM subunit [Rhizobium sp. SJZ105]